MPRPEQKRSERGKKDDLEIYEKQKKNIKITANRAPSGTSNGCVCVSVLFFDFGAIGQKHNMNTVCLGLKAYIIHIYSYKYIVFL